MQWRDGDLDAARSALSQALAYCRSDELREAIMTLWDGMVASGMISGELVPAEKAPAKDKDVPGEK